MKLSLIALLKANLICRFGKFVEIQFDQKGRISEAAIRTYLLERSRVCQLSDPERNCHCFYMFCAAPPKDLKRYKVVDPSTFHYLNQSNSYQIDELDESKEYFATKNAMDVVGINFEDNKDGYVSKNEMVLAIEETTSDQEISKRRRENMQSNRGPPNMGGGPPSNMGGGGPHKTLWLGVLKPSNNLRIEHCPWMSQQVEHQLFNTATSPNNRFHRSLRPLVRRLNSKPVLEDD
ncbi:hypothetical protein L6452_43685 [Arctium lappa]|uniref:Uncharacterized protein n=1 Tax=Arctium lappa TaxID=4217 RepID=A0ACB8XDL0_ARCLA|nr:hypothetical protein L6452_43685 [Arctium lappa]